MRRSITGCFNRPDDAFLDKYSASLFCLVHPSSVASAELDRGGAAVQEEKPRLPSSWTLAPVLLGGIPRHSQAYQESLQRVLVLPQGLLLRVGQARCTSQGSRPGGTPSDLNYDPRL